MSLQYTIRGGTGPIVDSTPVRPMIARGFNDRLAGRGWPVDFDTWPQIEQGRYENGRLIASNMMLAGAKIQPIRGNRYRGFAAGFYRAQEIVGAWRPDTVCDVDPSLKFRSTLNRRGFPLPVPTVSAR